MGLASLFGIFFTLFFILCIIFEIKRTSEYITPAVLIMAIAIVDSFLPLIVFDIFGPTVHPYIPQFGSSSYIHASIISFISLILFGVGYISVTSNLPYYKYRGICEGHNFRFSIGRIYSVMGICLSLITLNLYNQSEKYGSLLGYILGKTLRADYGVRVTDTVGLSQYLVTFESALIYIFVMMAMILLFYRDSSKK
jgi:hypothetical protein